MLKKLLAIAALLTLLIVVSVVVLLTRKSPASVPPFITATGDKFTFREVTFGTNHLPPLPAQAFSWRTLLTRVIPGRRGNSGHRTEAPSAVLWFEHTKSTNTSGGYNLVGSVVLTNGLELPFGNLRFYGNSGVAGQIVGLSAVPALHEKQLHVKLYDRKDYDRPVLLGELAVGNELFLKGPARSGELLPQTASDGDLSVTLVSLESGARSGRSGQNPLLTQTRAKFRIEQNGQLTRNWGPNRVSATNRLGGVVRSSTWSSSGEHDRPALEFQPVLVPGELYSFRVEMSRRGGAGFDSSEVWTVRGIPIPTNGGFTLVDTQWVSGAFTVQLHGVQTSESNPPWNKRFSDGTSIALKVLPEPEAFRFDLIRVTDQSGKSVDTAGSGSGNGEFSFGIRPKPDTKTVDVTFALHRSRYVHFQVVPGFARDGLKN